VHIDWTHEILQEGVEKAYAFLLRHFKLAENVPPRYLTRKVDRRLPGKGNSNSHGARPVY